MSKPSFLLIMTDTQGANVCGCYGQPWARTPRLDRLAAEGVRFDRAYSSCPVCTPARAAIFTGVHASAAGAWGNDVPLGNSLPTMGQRFQAAGWRTAYAGKWHLSANGYFDTGICPPGWEPAWWHDGANYCASLDDATRARWRRWQWRDPQAEQTWAWQVAERACRFLAQAGDDPFVLVASFDEPHGPHSCPAEYLERWRGHRHRIGPAAAAAPVGAYQRRWSDAHPPHVTDGCWDCPEYFAALEFADAQAGRILDALAATGRRDVHVIYTSDHGYQMGAHRLDGKGPCVFEESTRIPLVWRQPQGGTGVNHSPCAQVDLLPTMLDLAGLGVPPRCDGASLAPLLAAPQRLEDRSAHIEFNAFGLIGSRGLEPLRALVRGRWKLAVNLLAGEDELYDLDRDPHELVNRIGDPACAAERDRLHDELLGLLERRLDPFRGAHWADRPWRSTPPRPESLRELPDDHWSPAPWDYGSGRRVPWRGRG